MIAKASQIYILISKVILKLNFLIWKLFGKPDSYDKFFVRDQRTGFLYTKSLFVVKHGYKLNLKNPQTLSEKMVTRRLLCRNPLYPILTDKVEVRHWLEEQGLLGYEGLKLIPAHQITADANEIELDKDEKYVLKAAWASGKNIFCKDSSFDLDESVELLKKWQQEPYAINRLIWASHQIPRRIIVENLLSDQDGNVPEDYKFYVVQGSVEMIQVYLGRFSGPTKAHFNRELSPISNLVHNGKGGAICELPSNIEQMISIAEKLGEGLGFVRIDLYSFNGDIYFGEFTLCPGNGFGDFKPVDMDIELGTKWSLDKQYFVNTQN